MNLRTAGGIGALLGAIMGPAYANDNLPFDYEKWPKQVDGDQTTYRKDQQVVREFLGKINGISVIVIGYGEKSNSDNQEKTELSIFVKAMPGYSLTPENKLMFETGVKANCGKCHPIANRTSI